MAETGEITGDLTTMEITVTGFTGVASGFGFRRGHLQRSRHSGTEFGWPDVCRRRPMGAGPYYVSSGDGGSGGGLLLTNGAYNFRIYDYTDTFNNYGDQLAWFA